ncbi:MAG TPA: radical SAM protein [Vicinamibacteria bacterium]
MLTAQTVAAYNAAREPQADRSVLCHAPFVSLNFDQSGRVTACCYNRLFVIGTYPEQSVGEIWRGAQARALRQAFLEEAEAPGCDLCFHQLGSGNFASVLMRNFDRHSVGAPAPALDVAAPRVLEFEISNTCNLECVMCSGHWSSSIRANREKLPPLKSPYDRAFAGQLEEFLPALAAARFLGGEPFLIERYYEIWTAIRRRNPQARLSITTNATVLPGRARELLEDLRADIVVSLDGISAATYERVREGARFDTVMENLDYFVDYTRRRGTVTTLAVCPMTYNWKELPALQEFAQRRSLGLYFNTVLRPVEASLAGLPLGELAEVIGHLERAGPGAGAPPAHREQWDGLLSQLRAWQGEKREEARLCAEMAARVRAYAVPRAAAEAAAAGDGLLLPLVAALRIETERAAAASPGELRDVHLRMPPGTWSGEGAPRVRDVVLALHALCRYLDAEEGQAAARAGTAVAEEQARLRESLDDLDGAAGDGRAERLEELGRWMRARVEAGEGLALVNWMRRLVGVFEGDLGLALDFGGEMRRRLARRLGGARAAPDAEARAQVAGYFETLLREQMAQLLLSADGEPSAPEGDGAARPPIRDGRDLARVLEAMYLFHSCARPSADHARFRRRLDSCLDSVEATGHTAVACRMLESADLSRSYGYLVSAPEDWLLSAIEALD